MVLYHTRCAEYPVALTIIEGTVLAHCATCGGVLARQEEYPLHEVLHHALAPDEGLAGLLA